MSKFRCFDTYNLNNFSSSDYTKRRRRNTIFTEAQTIAIGNSSYQNGISSNSIPPGYLKKTDGSLYYGPVYVSTKSTDLNNCLVSARNYELLYDVLFGATPSPSDINGTDANLTSSSWEGNISKITFTHLSNSGPALSAIPDFSYNMIDYASRQDFFPIYDDPDGNPSTRYPGIVIDPCYNIFYNSCTSTSNPNNYMKNVTYTFNELKLTNPDLVKYLSKTTSRAYTHFPYPLNFQTTTCEKFQFTFILSFTNTNNTSIEYILENCLPICNKDKSIIFDKPRIKKGFNNLITILIRFKYTGKQSTTDGFTFCPYQVFNLNNISTTTREFDNLNYQDTNLSSLSLTDSLVSTKSVNLSIVNFYNATEAPVIIEQFNNIPLAPDGRQFYGLNKITINAKDKPIIKPNTSFEEAFKNVQEISIASSEGLNHWDTQHVTNMKSTFEKSGFNNKIDKWNIKNVKNMSFMFSDSSFNQSLNEWDTSNITDMSFMFYNAKQFNGDITNWNTINVTNMSHMFANAIAFDKMIKYDPTLNKWNTSKVENVTHMFLNATQFNNKYNINSKSDNKISLGWKFKPDLDLTKLINQ